jgi:hypothetical protein
VVPNMIYSNALKQNLKGKLNYDEDSDTFVNLTSKYLPNIRHFLEFCEENLITANTCDELELGELCSLYGCSTMKECDVLKLVKHFFPEIVIDEYKYNKYILRTQCKLWNKSEGILNVILQYKESHKLEIISIDDLYSEYTSNPVGKLVASKQYFENYIRMKFNEFIVYETFLQF